LNFLGNVSKDPEISNFMKILSLGLLNAGGRTDGRTDMTKIKDSFRNFAKALKNQQEYF